MFGRTSINWCLCVVLGLALPACEKGETEAPADNGDELDALTEKLLIAMRQGALADLRALANDELAAALDEREAAVFARTLAWLGDVSTPTKLGEQAVAGGVERKYALAFTRAELELTIVAVGGKLEGFHFEEVGWNSVVERAAEAEAGNLRVASFQFVDRLGRPLAKLSDPAAIDYDIAIEGLGAQLREHHLTIAKAVFDGEGNQVYRQDDDDEIRFSQAESGASGGKVSGNVKVPGPGSFTLELTIHDLVEGTTLVHRESFVIE